jgi:hypothetical protein
MSSVILPGTERLSKEMRHFFRIAGHLSLLGGDVNENN